MAGTHSIATRRRARALEIVDVHGVTHVLTPEALGAGRRASTGGYVAVCGDTVTRVPVAEAGGRYCQDLHRRDPRAEIRDEMSASERPRSRGWEVEVSKVLTGGQWAYSCLDCDTHLLTAAPPVALLRRAWQAWEAWEAAPLGGDYPAQMASLVAAAPRRWMDKLGWEGLAALVTLAALVGLAMVAWPR